MLEFLSEMPSALLVVAEAHLDDTHEGRRAALIRLSGTPSGSASIASMTFSAASKSQLANRANATAMRMMVSGRASQSSWLTISRASDANAAASGTRLSLKANEKMRPAVAIASDVRSPACVVSSRNSR